jgi:hypothetical protein
MDAGARESIREKYRLLGDIFNERARRVWAAVEAQQLGPGRISTIAETTGLSRTTIYEGLNELQEGRSGARLNRFARAVNSSGFLNICVGTSATRRWTRAFGCFLGHHRDAQTTTMPLPDSAAFGGVGRPRPYVYWNSRTRPGVRPGALA